MTTFRGFIAIELTPASRILEFENEIKKSGADVKLVEPQNIHITLKFLGDTEDQKIDDIDQILKESVKNIQPFSITLKGSGVFPNPNYLKIIWIGIIDGGIIGTLANKIDERLSDLGFQKEKRRFSPHLTIGRVKTARQKQQLLTIIEKYHDIEFNVEKICSITLKKSELTPKGPLYTTLREVAF